MTKVIMMLNRLKNMNKMKNRTMTKMMIVIQQKNKSKIFESINNMMEKIEANLKDQLENFNDMAEENNYRDEDDNEKNESYLYNGLKVKNTYLMCSYVFTSFHQRIWYMSS